MNKKHIIPMIFLLLLFTSCSLTSSVGKDQVKYIIHDDGSVTMEAQLKASDLEGRFQVSYKDDESTIQSNIEAYNQQFDSQITINTFKKGKDYGTFSITYSDPSIIYIELSATLEAYAQEFYDTYDELMAYGEFLTYDHGSLATAADYTGLEQATILIVSGFDAGAYYEVPGNIILISDEMSYKKRGKSTVFIESGNYGHIVFTP